MIKDLVPSEENRCVHIDEYVTLDNIEKLLSQADYICNVLPNTPDTTGILNDGVLKACGDKSPGFINIGRSNIVSEDSLLKALEAGWLSGAVLDVFDKEPLPQEHPFWTHPKVLVPNYPRFPSINYSFKRKISS